MSLFKAETRDKINIISCPEIMNAKTADEFRGTMDQWLGLPAKAHILDLRDTYSIVGSAFQPIVLFKQQLKNDGKFLFSINIDEKLREQIEREGLANIFSPVADLTEAKLKSGIPTKVREIDVDFINPFLTGAAETLKVQCHTECKPLRPTLKTAQKDSDIGIAGVLTLISDKFTGSIALCFPTQVFLNIYNNMFDENHTELTGEIQDAAGELLNIIYGYAKSHLNEKRGYALRGALPTVLTGEKLSVRQSQQGTAILLPFESTAGPFHIEIEVNDDVN